MVNGEWRMVNRWWRIKSEVINVLMIIGKRGKYFLFN